jgi:hypothetical protein
LSSSCPPRRSLRRLFLSFVDVLPAAPLTASLVSLHSSTSCSPRRSLRRLFLSLRDILPAAPLAVTLVSFTCRRLARRAAHCVACFFHSSSSCSPRRSLHCPFLSLFDVLHAALLAKSLVTFTRRHLARRAARCIACFFHLSTS